MSSFEFGFAFITFLIITYVCMFFSLANLLRMIAIEKYLLDKEKKEKKDKK